MCPCSELFCSVFSRIRAEYGEILRISECAEILHTSPYLVQMWENTDQNTSKYERFLRSVGQIFQKEYFI